MTEVEQFDDNTTERHVGDALLQLRTKLVNSERGQMLDLAVRFHYDNFRRASIEYQDYFFAPLNYTPFTLALVLPNGYGNTWIKVNNEIYGNGIMRQNLTEFFLGDNWKVSAVFLRFCVAAAPTMIQSIFYRCIQIGCIASSTTWRATSSRLPRRSSWNLLNCSTTNSSGPNSTSRS